MVFPLLLGAAAAPTEYKPELRQSTYAPAAVRDPFGGTVTQPAVTGKVAMATAPAASFPFRLEGIMYEPRQPSAIINNQVVVLQKTVVLRSGGLAVEVRAVEIAADRVVLEVGTERVELRLAKPPKTP
jgi:hypothetical protein